MGPSKLVQTLSYFCLSLGYPVRRLIAIHRIEAMDVAVPVNENFVAPPSPRKIGLDTVVLQRMDRAE